MVTQGEENEIIARYEAKKAEEKALLLRQRQEKREEKEKAISESLAERMSNEYFDETKNCVHPHRYNEWKQALKNLFKIGGYYSNLAEVVCVMKVLNGNDKRKAEWAYDMIQKNNVRYEDSHKKRRVPQSVGVNLLDCIVTFHKNGSEFFKYYKSSKNELTQEQIQCYEQTNAQNKKLSSGLEK